MYEDSKINISDSFLNDYMFESDKLNEMTKKFILSNKF